jgi:hypothetical protein
MADIWYIYRHKGVLVQEVTFGRSILFSATSFQINKAHTQYCGFDKLTSRI